MCGVCNTDKETKHTALNTPPTPTCVCTCTCTSCIELSFGGDTLVLSVISRTCVTLRDSLSSYIHCIHCTDSDVLKAIIKFSRAYIMRMIKCSVISPLHQVPCTYITTGRVRCTPLLIGHTAHIGLPGTPPKELSWIKTYKSISGRTALRIEL